MTPRRAELLFTGGLALALILLQSVGLTRPFLRHHEANGTEFSKHARNHLKFGLGKTMGLMLDVSGPRLEPFGNYREYYYSNHPPLSALLLAGVFAVFGSSEAVFRGFLIAVSLACLLLFRRLAARVLEPPWDRVASVVFALLPMFVFYSIVTCLQVVALAGVLGAYLFYFRWRESRSGRDYAGLAGCLVVACYSSWEGYYAAPALVVAHAWSRRPGLRPVLALLGLNVAIFGVYLLHLYAADPAGLDPIRSLLTAGAARSWIGGPSPFRYALGEARELGLMFTVPVLLAAAFWAISRWKAPRTESDGVIAGAALLGLHELVFATLASGHEYFSYFLVVFLPLAAAAGLRALRERQARLAPAASLLLAVAFLGQSGWVLSRRLLNEGGYEFYYRLGRAIDGATRPDDRVLILTNNIPFYTPYYGDRYAMYYDAEGGEFMPECSGGRRTGVTESDVLDLIRGDAGGFDVAVSAEKETVLPEVRWLQGLDDATLEAFGVETSRSKRRELLERRCGAPRLHGGFLFWDLKGRRR